MTSNKQIAEVTAQKFEKHPPALINYKSGDPFIDFDHDALRDYLQTALDEATAEAKRTEGKLTITPISVKGESILNFGDRSIQMPTEWAERFQHYHDCHDNLHALGAEKLCTKLELADAKVYWLNEIYKGLLCAGSHFGIKYPGDEEILKIYREK